MATNADNVSVDEAVRRIEASWGRLMHTMTARPEADYTGKPDAAGWTALDHMAHVAAWQRSWIPWLQGRPRHEGLGVTADAFQMDFDPLNEIVRAQSAGKSYDEVMTGARQGHEAVIRAIGTFDPDDARETRGVPADALSNVGSVLIENLADHYDAHRGYIERMLAG